MNFEGLLDNLQDWELTLKDNDKKVKSLTSSKGGLIGRRLATESTSKSMANHDILNRLSVDHATEGPLVDANSEKELGNEFFKQKKYNEAIDCYSRSIALSPTAVTYGNRAMAYLKIKRFREAEADCTEALGLDDRYIKAYSRRGTARKELGNLKEALDDVQFALRLEPSNLEIKKQSIEIKSLLEKAIFQKASGGSRSSAQGVKISENKFDPKGNSKGTLPLPARNEKRGISEISNSNQVLFKIPVSAEETERRNKIEDRRADGCQNSGSQFRMQRSPNASGKFGTPELETSVHELASKAASQAMLESMENIRPPNSAYEFEVSWRGFCGDCSLQARFLKISPPTTLPGIFKNALSASMLVDIIKGLASFFSTDMELSIKYLENLTKVSRFDMLIMCLPAADKGVLRRLWNEVFLNEDVPEEHKVVLGKLQVKYLLQ